MPNVYPANLALRRVLERGEIRNFFDGSRAGEYIGSVAVYHDAELDVDATMQWVGISFEERGSLITDGRYIPKIGGGEVEPKIVLRTGLTNEERRVTAGWAIGHYFMTDRPGTAYGIGYHLLGGEAIHAPIGDAFCEYFSLRMVNPNETNAASLERQAKEAAEVPVDYEAYVLKRQIAGRRRV